MLWESHRVARSQLWLDAPPPKCHYCCFTVVSGLVPKVISTKWKHFNHQNGASLSSDYYCIPQRSPTYCIWQTGNLPGGQEGVCSRRKAKTSILSTQKTNFEFIISWEHKSQRSAGQTRPPDHLIQYLVSHSGQIDSPEGIEIMEWM